MTEWKWKQRSTPKIWNVNEPFAPPSFRWLPIPLIPTEVPSSFVVQDELSLTFTGGLGGLKRQTNTQVVARGHSAYELSGQSFDQAITLTEVRVSLKILCVRLTMLKQLMDVLRFTLAARFAPAPVVINQPMNSPRYLTSHLFVSFCARLNVIVEKCEVLWKFGSSWPLLSTRNLMFLRILCFLVIAFFRAYSLQFVYHVIAFTIHCNTASL